MVGCSEEGSQYFRLMTHVVFPPSRAESAVLLKILGKRVNGACLLARHTQVPDLIVLSCRRMGHTLNEFKCLLQLRMYLERTFGSVRST